MLPSTTRVRNHESTFRLYPQRWIVLFSFSLLSMTSSWMWITWSPIAAPIAEFWNVSEGDVDALAGVYMYVYVPGSFISLWLVVQVLHLSRGLLVGAVLDLVGAYIRYVGMNNYQHVYIGTLLCAMAQTFTLSVPPLLSTNWFGADERATATSLGVLANQFGTAVGLGATGLINFYNTNNELNVDTLKTYLGGQLGAASVALLFVFIFVSSDRPPTPPSTAAAMLLSNATEDTLPTFTNDVTTEESALVNNVTETKLSPTYLESVQITFKNSLSFVFIFGLSIGVYYTIPTFLSQLVMCSPRKSGWLGVLYQLSGVVGSFLSGVILDRYQRHLLLCFILLGGAVSSLLIFILTNQYQLAVFGAGFCLAAMNTVGLELGTAITYPASEAAVAGILECAAELGGFLLVSIGASLSIVGHGFLALLCAIVLCSMTILSCNCNHAKLKRPQ